MLKKLTWYRIVRALTPIAYAVLLVKGYMSKNLAYMIILLSATLLGGAWFCGWLCPFGFAQEWLGKLGRLLRLPRLRLPAKVAKWVNLLRYILFGLSFLGLALVLLIQSPFASFMGIVDQNMSYISKTAWILLGTFLGLSLFIDRPFCRYFCPEGARYGVFSLARLFTITRDEEKCVSCKKCDIKCPSQIEISTRPAVRNAQCINCMECIAACPVKGTLKFSWAFKKK
ncbi:MAG: 4Fe-4S binding protein [Spirochaetales bacterium]|nr:4Fe-4S binding protein [Spirochaetales bacterium]